MIKNFKQKRLYTVMKDGVMMDTHYTLRGALEDIGKQITKRKFGSMLVSVQTAIRLGYSIDQRIEYK